MRSHPHLTFPWDSHFIPPAWDVWGEVRGPKDAALLGRWLLDHPNVKRWSLREPIEFEKDPTFAGVVSALYSTYARAEGKQRWGDKTAHYVLYLPLLAELFKGAQFLHIIRDGRDVARSWIRHPLGAGNLVEATLMWRKCVEAGRRNGPRLGAGRYREVRYEALLEDPEATLRGILAWAGEDFSPRVLVRSSLKSLRWSPSLKGDGIVRTNFDRWRTEMTPRDRRTFEGLAGDLLEILGYQTEGGGRVPGTLARLGGGIQQRAVWIMRRLDPGRRSELWLPFLWTLAFKEVARRRPAGPSVTARRAQ